MIKCHVKKGDSVKRGQKIARIATAQTPFLHFETLQGFERFDPERYLK